MLTMLKNWEGSIEINGEQYPDVKRAICDFKADTQEIHIVLHPVAVKAENKSNNKVQEQATDKQYRITVKQYMTKKAEPQFDFMAKWNNDVPMPLRTMTGIIDKETRGMYHMILHGDIWAEKMCSCMKCGRKLDNPISQYFGIGPECGGHHYVNPFDSEEELQEAVSQYKKKLQETVWEGWVIKSAVTEMVEV